MKKKRSKRLQAALIKALLRLFSVLPIAVLHRLGDALGYPLLWIPNELCRVARVNIALCFPELSEHERRGLLLRTLKESAKTAAELGPLWFQPPDKILRRITKVTGRELLDELLLQGKGVVLLIPHLGAWEMVTLYISIHFVGRYPLTGLFRPPRMMELGETMLQARRRCGADFVPTTLAGVRKLYHTLEQGGVIGVLPDQEPGVGKSIFAPFFGTSASTMGLVSRLLRRTGAKPIYAYISRLPQGRGFEMHFLPAPAGIEDDDLATAARRLNEGVENCILRVPEQYQWGYKRFRTRPEGEAPIY